ncbi:hypothetical protein FC83_GL002052 [Agrilactobacillus composti DSM 18527 = JCM 14202]|uniref:Molybdate ABC transporter substrate-binding protein n=1 Tax=Agrilactobacillus composti DSM 18527 = JCM 14202 TaxID=1423734 RepID=X0PP70_9LACO|nr:molybdate ABC transporter substrate-binding protein [Agrilactobacillus composti]KRM34912.1 hypothetical protein FC83_GL002052 [Agrilactobacillus composti DSM 18527 = JCM 14202]GAF38791.1 molybdenum ABC transporter, periplasmic molybdenum-binding protein ModA [Agrilactobacillus composti DSM 18527 = JCM 14202]
MNKKKLHLVLLLGGIFMLGLGLFKSPTPVQAADKVSIHYSAAASLKDVLTDIAKDYQAKNPDVTIELDFAGSGQIKQKVLSGAPIDGVLTASKEDMTALTKPKKATDDFALLSNDLVLVQNKKDKALKGSLTKQLTKAKKIALGEPKLVPAGRYATDTMNYLKLTKKLKSKFVYANDVRQTLAYVSSGNAQVGFVYRTDAKISKDVKIIKSIPGKYHTPIRYYVAATATDQTKKDAVNAFNKYLKTKPATTKLKAAGFGIVK